MTEDDKNDLPTASKADPATDPLVHGDVGGGHALGDNVDGGVGHGGFIANSVTNPETAPGELYGVLAEFETPGALIKAARKVKEAGYTDFDCYSPFAVHGIDDAMGIKRTILPVLVFCGGAAGLIGGVFLQWWMNSYDWPWNVSGKPTWSIPANVPIAFETTILMSVLTAFFGMWVLNKLPQVWHPFFRLDRFTKATDDGFLLGIEAKDERFDLVKTTELLQQAGATAVEPCHHDPDPRSKKMPIWVWGFIVATSMLALIPLALIARARASKSKDPHWHVFADMDFQPKAKSDAPFDEFPDGRANRGEIPGTVARGNLKDDTELYYGLDRLEGGAWITGFPAKVAVTDKTIQRGRQRYDIYCAPCHGLDGQGMGTVPERLKLSGKTWLPANLTAASLVVLPNGQLFNIISHGRNTMLGYASQIPVADRWAIVLYVRALQRSQHATNGDVPPGTPVR